MKAATPSPRELGKRFEGDSRALAGRTVGRVSMEEHMANYPGGERAHGQGKEQRKEVRREEWSEGMRYEPHSYFMAGGLGSPPETSA